MLLVGNILSASTGTGGLCGDLAVALKSAGWSVLTTTDILGRFALLLDFLLNECRQRHRYGVAQFDSSYGA